MFPAFVPQRESSVEQRRLIGGASRRDRALRLSWTAACSRQQGSMKDGFRCLDEHCPYQKVHRAGFSGVAHGA
jgi:hypothetical protein